MWPKSKLKQNGRERERKRGVGSRTKREKELSILNSQISISLFI